MTKLFKNIKHILKENINEILIFGLFIILSILTIHSPRYYPFFILSLGYLFTYIAYVYYDLRMGGIIVLPLLVLYALKDPLFIMLFIASSLICYVSIKLIKRYTLMYGRRLFTSSLTISLGVAMISSIFNGIGCLVIPGVFAYNLDRDLKPVQSIVTFIAGFSVLYVIGILIMMM